MKISFGQENRQLTGPIYDGICMRQEFEAKAERLISVSIYFATYKRQNPGSVTVELFDFRQRQIANVTFDSSKLSDNSYREFGIGAVLIPGQRYELKVWTKNCRAGLSPTAAWGKKQEDFYFFIGRSLVRDGDLCCIFEYEEEPEVTELTEVTEVTEKAKTLGIPGLVSVIIPNFKCSQFLSKCLASIARQTYSCLEVIVVDDGSPDAAKAADIVETFKAVIPSLCIIPLLENRGAPAARNVGARLASGEYLFFCDADVVLYPEAIEILVRCLIEVPGVDFSYGGFKWGNRRVHPIPFDSEKLKQGNYITTMSMIRNSKFPGWDEDLKRHQDWDLWLTVVDKGGKGVCCGKYLFSTPHREGSISTDGNIPLKESKEIVARKHGILI